MKNINSLKDVSQFRRVYEGGRSLANKYLVLYVLPGQGDFRLGISASKKVGNSVIRHRVIRLIRESYMCFKDQLPDCYHLVVVARVASGSCSFSQIRDSLGRLLEQHRLIQNVQKFTD